MKYRKVGKTGVEVSPLGFGMMRLPKTSGGEVDYKLSESMVRYAIDHGINYFDTAYVYLNGESEKVTGRILEGGLRDKVYIATKSPVSRFKQASDFDNCLTEELERLQTDRIDFYLLHALTAQSWKNKVKKFDFLSKMEAAKKSGKVRFIGFSMHDHFDLFKEMVDCGVPWDFCMIQLNYMDIEFQAGVKGLKYATDKGLGVMIMEPLRGGFLADVPPKIREVFDNAEPKPSQKAKSANLSDQKKTLKTPVEWAFDFLWNMPEVTCALSGMNKMEHVRENIEYANRAFPGMLSKEENAVLDRVMKRIAEFSVVPCTGCGYCIPCPVGVDIPRHFQMFNRLKLGVDPNRIKNEFTHLKKSPASWNECFECHRCQRVCPQHIKVEAELKAVAAEMEELK